MSDFNLTKFGYGRNIALEGGGSPIPKSKCQNSDKMLTFL